MDSKKEPADSTQADFPKPSYPALEGFIEHATRGDVEALFSEVRQGLAELKGPKAQQAQKMGVALDRTEELLGLLLETRDKMSNR
jgi:hypothetical protein